MEINGVFLQWMTERVVFFKILIWAQIETFVLSSIDRILLILITSFFPYYEMWGPKERRPSKELHRVTDAGRAMWEQNDFDATEYEDRTTWDIHLSAEYVHLPAVLRSSGNADLRSCPSVSIDLLVTQTLTKNWPQSSRSPRIKRLGGKAAPVLCSRGQGNTVNTCGRCGFP